MTSRLWGSLFASNLDMTNLKQSWIWLKLSDVMAKIERFGTRVKFMTIVEKGTLIELRAYPMGRYPKKFEKTVFCIGCHEETNHEFDVCKTVSNIMES